MPAKAGKRRGAPARRTQGRFRACRTKVTLDEAVRLVTHPAAGAVVTFVAVVRQDPGVRGLRYQGSARLLTDALRNVGETMEARTPGVRLSILHRLGAVPVGGLTIVLAASAPHRQEAFAACRAAFEAVRRQAPVKKHELRARRGR
jgi:molybdopterin synthase catalytic subunit